MAKSSVKYQKATSHLKKHNGREDEPSYLLPQDFRTEPNVKWEAEISAKDFFESEVAKTNRKGGRIPKFENSHWEAVLNLNGDHGLTDCQAVAEHIEKKFNIKCHSIYIHKDEGHLRHKETGKELSGGIDYYTKNGISYYIKDKKKTNEPLDLSEYEPIYNYHAHLEFTTYKDKKQNWQQGLVRPKLMQLQSEVAEILKMERGETNTKKRSLSHHEFKQEQHAIQNATEPIKKELFKTKEATQDLKKQIEKKEQELEAERLTSKEALQELEAIRKEMKGQGFTKEQFAHINELKKGIKEKTREPMTRQDIEQLKQDIKNHSGIFSKKDNVINALTEKLAEAENDKAVLNQIVSFTEQNEAKIIETIRQELENENKAVLERLKHEQETQLKTENEKFKSNLRYELVQETNKLAVSRTNYERKTNDLATAEAKVKEAEADYTRKRQELTQITLIQELNQAHEADLKKEKEEKEKLKQKLQQLKADNERLEIIKTEAIKLKEKAEQELKEAKEKIKAMTETIERAIKMSFQCVYDRISKFNSKHIIFKDFIMLDSKEQERVMNSNIEAKKDIERENKEKEQEKNRDRNRGFGR